MKFLIPVYSLFALFLYSTPMSAMNYTPYTTGTQRDDEGRNFYHVLAHNCNRQGGVRQVLYDFEKSIGKDTQEFMVTWSMTQKDNHGKTPVDIVTDIINQGPGCLDCAQLMEFFAFVDNNTANDGIFRLKKSIKIDDQFKEVDGREIMDILKKLFNGVIH